MKTYYCYLSPFPFNVVNSILNGYLFIDPITQGTINYPTTADGGIGNNFTLPSSSYSLTAWDGLFYPYSNNFTANNSINVLMPSLKGDYTIFFITSSLQSPLELFFNYGDGSAVEKYTLSYNSNFNYPNIKTYQYGLNGVSVKYTNPSHIYTSPISATTYYHSITVVNSDLSFNIYNISFTQYPNSLYDIDNIHILEQVPLSNNKSNLAIIEIPQMKIVIDLICMSSQKVTTSTQLLSTLTTTISSNSIQILSGFLVNP